MVAKCARYILLGRSFAVGRGRGRGHVVERRELGGSGFGYSCCFCSG